jgi:hypothetical protein
MLHCTWDDDAVSHPFTLIVLKTVIAMVRCARAKWRPCLGILTLYLALFVRPAIAQKYTGIDLFTLARSDASSFPTIIAGHAVSGQVVGREPGLGGTAGTLTQSVSQSGILPYHAVAWNRPNGAEINLSPTGFFTSDASATDGVYQVGSGTDTESVLPGVGPVYSNSHALLWSGTADSVIILDPPGYHEVAAVGLHGSQQVGEGSRVVDSGIVEHALLWNGSASSFVDLHPIKLAGFDQSYANGTDGTYQVGDGSLSSGKYHALQWSGTADSAIDLHPTKLSGFDYSFAIATSGGQQVGNGFGTDFVRHALLWRGTADSAVDLQPTNLSGFNDSYAIGTDGVHQVGYGDGTDFDKHALLWTGTADSAVDLNLLLPAGFLSSSANSIDSHGNIFGVATDSNFNLHAVEWIQVPEPSTHLILFAGILAIGCRGRREIFL